MKKLYPLVILLVAATVAVAQNSFLRDNEFVINPYPLSPSYSGFNNNHEIFASYINHFSGVAGSPNSVWVNYNGIVKGNFGIGASVRYERYGAFRNIRADITTAYHLKIATDHKLSIGLGLSVTQASLDFSNSNSDPLNDAGLNNAETKNGIGLNASFGITYAWKKFNLTVAAPGIIPMKADGKLFLSSQPIHIRAHTSYDIAINRQWSVKPQFVLDYILHAPINYNGIVSVKYDNLLWLNLGYGAQSIISTGLGTLIGQRFTFQYTFKYGLSGIAKSPYGNHEICLGVLVGKIKPSHINNSIFSKKSKSPYHEWE
jgi:type IX secretion system PorP/SprF family membrane protein